MDNRVPCGARACDRGGPRYLRVSPFPCVTKTRLNHIVKSASSRRQVARGYSCAASREVPLPRRAGTPRRVKETGRPAQRRMHLARGPGSSLSIPSPETQPLDPRSSLRPARRQASGQIVLDLETTRRIRPGKLGENAISKQNLKHI